MSATTSHDRAGQSTPCAATTKRGAPCRNRAKASETLCAVHLGSAHRPTKLTDELQAKLAALLRNGNYIEAACGVARVSTSAYYAWIERGEADQEAGVGSVFSEFVDAVNAARAEGEALLLQEVRRAGGHDWRAAAWILERTMPAKYGRRTEIKHDATFRTDVREIPEDEDRLLTVAQLLVDIGVIDPSKGERDG